MLRIAASYGGKRWHFPLPKATATLGSTADSEIVLPVPGVSKQHVRIERIEGGLRLHDLGSKNGIHRDGERLERVDLRRGQSVRLGRALLSIEDVSSGDVAIGLHLEPGPVDSSRAEVEIEESTTTTGFGATTSEVSPAVALALIRRIEQEGIVPGSASGALLLESIRRVLEARWVVIAEVEGEVGSRTEGPPLRAVAGEVPSEDALATLRHALSTRSDGSVPARGLLIAGSPGAKPVLAALRVRSESTPKPWQLDFFDFIAARLAGENRPVPATKRTRRPRAGELLLPEGFVGGPSPAMTRLLESIRSTVHSNLDVLLLGESGTGKELVSRLIHDSGSTSTGPFIAINCAAIPTELLEAELFGVEARVATGVDPRPGLFVRAEGGTLFLDEIGDMSEPMQAKLLRALQEREVLPVGAHRPKRINVRVISASNKPLVQLVRDGRFRTDLFYRLRGLQFHLPPLRERREDIPALVGVFARAASALYGKHLRGVSRNALELLARHDWPGNVRELRNEVERAVLLSEDFACLEARHFASIQWQVENRDELARSEPAPSASAAARPDQRLPPAGPGDVPESLRLDERVDAVESEAIRTALAAAGGNKSRAAQMLGITRNGLALKMKRLGIR
jgi:DNA-binding NtrC family response regulator